jgi:hypothetical protein
MTSPPLIIMLDSNHVIVWEDVPPPPPLEPSSWQEADPADLRNARRSKRGPRDTTNASYLHNVAKQAAECAHRLLGPRLEGDYAFSVVPEDFAILLAGPLRRVMRRGEHDITNPLVWQTAVAAFVLAGVSPSAWVAAIWGAERETPVANPGFSEGVLLQAVAASVRTLALSLAQSGAFTAEPAELEQRLEQDLRRHLVTAGFDVDDPLVWETAVASFVAWGVSPLAFGAAVFTS